MKFHQRKFMSYDEERMVYVYGKRARFYRLRRLHLGWQISICMFGIMAMGASLYSIKPNFLPHVLGLSSPSAQQNVDKTTEDSMIQKNKGSSKEPPKVSNTTTTATVQPIAVAEDTVRSTNCVAAQPGHTGLATSSAAELRKLAQYEQLCGGTVADRTSFFVPTPATVTQAQASAVAVAATLKAYFQAGVSPLVFMEPNSPNGDNLDLAQYANGAYDSALNAYFVGLKNAGVTNSMMGMWVYLPEGNLPLWTTVDPTIYSAVVTNTATLQKKYFPQSQSSIMLDSVSYPVNATWGQGKFVSLVPYVAGIPKGLIDSFGLQGFPWVSPADQPASTSYNPSSYLRTDFAVEAANVLGVSSIWINTGTFKQMYANKPGQTVQATATERQTMLNGVVNRAAQIKSQGFSVAIHIFAQNKANTSEGTDWSYWKNAPADDPNSSVFSTFAHGAMAAGVSVWLYDTAD